MQESACKFTTSLDRVPPKPWSDQNLDNGVDMITEDILPSLALHATVLFAAISMMICTTMGAKCRLKIIVSGRRMIMMMQPTTVWTCVTLLACFAGHADALTYYEEGICLESAYNKKGGLTCEAGDVRKGFVSSFSGQAECNAGENFFVDVSVALELTTAADRYDPGVYFGINGENAFTGNKCLVEVLGKEDNVTNSGLLLNVDSDICFDTSDKANTIFSVNNLSVKCQDSLTDPIGNSTMSICYTYQVQDQNCTSFTDSCCGFPCNNTGQPGRDIGGGKFTCLQPAPGSVSSAPNPTFLHHFLTTYSPYLHFYKSEMLL